MNHAPTTGPSQLTVTTPVHTLPVKLCNIPQLNKQHQLIKSSKFLIILCGYLQNKAYKLDCSLKFKHQFHAARIRLTHLVPGSGNSTGDLEYKPYVTAEPDVKTVTLNGSEDFLILGCDGLWDFVSENEVLYAIYQQIRDAPDLKSHKIPNFQALNQHYSQATPGVTPLESSDKSRHVYQLVSLPLCSLISASWLSKAVAKGGFLVVQTPSEIL
uniref:PPM-type phosphatase domain-containing protein n=1 Tax=Timema tahoe TaxID=61484 RepID=A0A7R9INL9_9NEOP|nr:unnamed protein product [Timema tahoe]